MLNDRVWKTMEGKKVDNIVGEVAALTVTGERSITVGTDSQQDGRGTEFVTVIVLLKPGKGGRVFYTNERVPRIKSLRERLMREVWMSVELGLEMNYLVPEGSPMTVHVDANPDVRFKSSKYVQELVGMVVGQGFDVAVKPDSWVATHAADHVVKYKVLDK